MKALLFDFDGVIVNSEPLWLERAKKLFKEYVPNWQDSYYDQIIGLNNNDTYIALREKFGATISAEEYKQGTDAIALTIYDDCEPMPGVIDFIKALHEKGVTLAIATSSYHHWISRAHERLNITNYFDAIVSAIDELPADRGKPCPDVYLEAAKRLNTGPSNCLVIEDSDHGVQAGTDAGCTVFGYRNSVNEGQNLAQASQIITHFNQVNIDQLFN